MLLQRALGPVTNLLSRFLAWQPFTVRGALVLSLSIVALKYLAVPEDDLTAYILGGAGIGIVVLCALASLYSARRARRRLGVDMFFDSAHALSQREVPAGITLTNSHVLPFLTFEISRIFTQPGPESPTHLLRGMQREEKRYLIDTVRFPHRGYWDVEGLKCRISDAFGLCACSWVEPVAVSLEVSAPTLGIRPLPIVFGSSRAGDQFSAVEVRSGDPYDMKAYDPSDGVSRILWKTFARSGELIVRRPEPAVVPEGEVAVYLIARQDEDYVAGALLSYLEHLRREQIVVLFGTDGMMSGTGAGSETVKRERLTPEGSGFTSDPERTLHAINHVVWHKDVGTGLGFDAYLESLSGSGRTIYQCIVFGALDFDHDWLTHLHRAAAQQMVKLSLAFVPRTVDPFEQSAVRTTRSQLENQLRRLLPKSVSREPRGGSLKMFSNAGGIAPAGVETFVCESTEMPVQY